MFFIDWSGGLNKTINKTDYIKVGWSWIYMFACSIHCICNGQHGYELQIEYEQARAMYEW